MTARGAPAGRAGHVTTDRAEVIHLAGFGLLSPALDAESGPAFSAEAGDGLRRCGWGRFFHRLGERGLAVEHDPAGGPPRFVPVAGASRRPPALGPALRSARRFCRALRGHPPQGE